MEINERVENLQTLMVLNRIKILQMVFQKDECVCQIVKKLDIKHNLISHHLKILVKNGYLTSNKHGQHVTYSLSPARRAIVADVLSLVNTEKL